MHTPLPHLVTDYLEREAALMSVVPPENSALGKNLQISPMGLIPKRSKPGKWRLIVNLSAPSGASVNDGINKECFPMLPNSWILGISNLKIGARCGASASPGPVATGYMMGEGYLCGQCLAVWAKICPEDLLALADAAQWILLAKGVENLLHYLDDFIFAASSRSAAEEMKQVLIDTWAQLEIPMEPKNWRAQQQVWPFWSYYSTPADKLSWLEAVLQATLGRRAVTQRDLQSLVGLLQHATKVMWPSRSFMQRFHAILGQTGLPTTESSWTRWQKLTYCGGIPSQQNGTGFQYYGIKRGNTRDPSGVRCVWELGLWGISWFQIKRTPRLQPCLIQAEIHNTNRDWKRSWFHWNIPYYSIPCALIRTWRMKKG